MQDCSRNTDPHLLVRDGTSRASRSAPELDPSRIPVDERRIEHDIAFARDVAAYVRFISAGTDGAVNAQAGSWAPLFENDISTRFALAAVQDLDAWPRAVGTHLEVITAAHDDTEAAAAIDAFGALLSCMGTLALRLDALLVSLDDEYRRMTPGERDSAGSFTLRASLRRGIRQRLAAVIRDAIAWRAAAQEEELLPAGIPPSGLRLFGHGLAAFPDGRESSLSTDWMVSPAASWRDYHDAVPPDGRIFGSGVTPLEQLRHAASHTLVLAALAECRGALQRAVADAAADLRTSLTSWNRHEPHAALFLAFLQLFGTARAELNGFTERHLRFHTRDILGLRERGALPGRAHVVIELTKHAAPVAIAAGTRFRAGKDAAGLDAYHAAVETTLISRAAIAEVKSIYHHGGAVVQRPDLPPADDTGRIYASPVTRSDDGLGAALTSADASWHPFFTTVVTDGVLSGIRMPQAQVGFAVTSHLLFLAGGTRVVTLTCTVAAGLDSVVTGEDGSLIVNGEAVSPDVFTGSFTTKKGWIEHVPLQLTVTAGSAPGTGTLTLEAVLEGGAAAVTAYDAKVHGSGYETAAPLMRVMLAHTAARYGYRAFHAVELSGIRIEVDVTGLPTAVVSTDAGPADISKPFQPFGPSPIAGNALVVGSKEAFRKELSRLHCRIDWLTTPLPDGVNASGVTCGVDFLIDGRWVADDTVEVPLYDSPVEVIPEHSVPDVAAHAAAFAGDDDREAPYAAASRRGFFRLTLRTGFSQTEYLERLSRFIIDVSGITRNAIMENIAAFPFTRMPDVAGLEKGGKAAEEAATRGELRMGGTNGDDTLPVPVPGPVIRSLLLDYSAGHDIDVFSPDEQMFADRRERFVHVAPFGTAEQHAVLKRRADAPDARIHLLPRFAGSGDGTAAVFDAECHIGITNLEPPQLLSILFQVADGTADPRSEKPRPHIRWSYLRDNEWIDFERTAVIDRTSELLISGIVHVAVPRDATATNTLLPSGMHWIRAAVTSESDTVCRLIGVHAQAVETVFVDTANDPGFASSLLPAGTIRKLADPVSSVKSVSQPYAGFGGRGSESPAEFATRVSERLRHKDRAVALWDYERLVLEAFPGVGRATCLPHTQFEPTTDGLGIYREAAPGHVTVIALPHPATAHIPDPLRPYTSLSVLKEIETYLKSRLSPFVRLHVHNPVFEEVQVAFRVRFRTGSDETHCTTLLNETIISALSPWTAAGGTVPDVGGVIHASAIVAVIEAQPYVDYLTDLVLRHAVPMESGTVMIPKDAVTGSTAVSMLVSARRHDIVVLDRDTEESRTNQCPEIQ